MTSRYEITTLPNNDGSTPRVVRYEINSGRTWFLNHSLNTWESVKEETKTKAKKAKR